MNTKNNQRYQHMDLCMKTAFMTLLRDHRFDDITVKRICDLAGVDRGTFYHHYPDIYGMIDELIADLDLDLKERLAAWKKVPAKEWSSPFVPYLHFMKEHHQFYHIALQHRRHVPMKDLFVPLWDDLVLPQCHAAGIWDEEEIYYYYLAFQSEITMILWHWLDTGCQMDDEKMAAVMLNCLPLPERAIMDLPNAPVCSS